MTNANASGRGPEQNAAAPGRGIYLVANRRSEEECRNLVYSIRHMGCQLPIRILPYGGEPLRMAGQFDDVRIVSLLDLPSEAHAFVRELKQRLPLCAPGLLHRFYAWFGEFDEFLYSDNDVVALMNWEELFPYLAAADLVHADMEYSTRGKFNFVQPERFEEMMGAGSLEQAVTAGHFLCRPDERQKQHLMAAAEWIQAHPEIAKAHDQAMMHLAIVMGGWKALNLCKPPHSWASSWAGDYANVLDVLAMTQGRCRKISHLHYSGGHPSGAEAIEELLYSSLSAKRRKRELFRALLSELSGWGEIKWFAQRVRRRILRK